MAAGRAGALAAPGLTAVKKEKKPRACARGNDCWELVLGRSPARRVACAVRSGQSISTAPRPEPGRPTARPSPADSWPAPPPGARRARTSVAGYRNPAAPVPAGTRCDAIVGRPVQAEVIVFDAEAQVLQHQIFDAGADRPAGGFARLAANKRRTAGGGQACPLNCGEPRHPPSRPSRTRACG